MRLLHQSPDWFADFPLEHKADNQSRPPYDSEFYDARVGISKAGVVQSLKRQGYDVVFAGDGPPDFAPAQIADVVFAKKILLEKCLEANIKTQPFETFDDVYACLQGG